MVLTYFKGFLECWVYKKHVMEAVVTSGALIGGFGIVMVFFYLNVLHYTLVKRNQTCIERLDNKNNKGKDQVDDSIYDFGTYYNFC